ncbi:MAG: flippase-like domain-containing protein [Flavobacteriaceae bacterium]|nr:MAG: flippase-like domain-containing protein [Flavobacteriaceae bacterium]
MRIGIAILACWLILKDLDFAQFVATLKSLNVWIFFAALGAFIFGQCLIAFRWWIFLYAQKISVPIFLSVKLTFLGTFFNNFMPSSVGGDLVRAWYISRHTDKKLQAALGVLADRMMGLMATAILALSSYLIFMRGQEGLFQVDEQKSGIGDLLSKFQVSPYYVFLWGVILVGILFVLSGFFDLKMVLGKLSGFIKHSFEQAREVVLVYVHHPLVLIFGLSLTIFLQSLVILSLWLIGSNLGISAQLRYYFVFFPMVWVISAIPISIGGLGILEGGVVLLFVQFTHADPDVVLAMALCQRLTWILASIPGLVVHLTGMHRLKASEC